MENLRWLMEFTKMNTASNCNMLSLKKCERNYVCCLLLTTNIPIPVNLVLLIVYLKEKKNKKKTQTLMQQKRHSNISLFKVVWYRLVLHFIIYSFSKQKITKCLLRYYKGQRQHSVSLELIILTWQSQLLCYYFIFSK